MSDIDSVTPSRSTEEQSVGSDRADRRGLAVFRSRLFWKLYAGYVVVILLSAGIVGGLIAGEVENKRREILERNIEDTCRWLARSLVPVMNDPDDIEKTISAFTKTSSLSVTFEIYSPILELRAVYPETLSIDSPPDIYAPGAFQVGEAQTHRGSPALVLVREIRRGAGLEGYLRAHLSTDSVASNVRDLYSVVAIGALVAATAGLLLGFLLARRLTAPIESMTVVAEEMAAGNYRQRVPVGATDEVGKLARAFNTMARQLHDRMELVTQENNKLNAVLGGMVEGVVAVDHDERMIHINGAARRILEISDEAQGQPIWRVTRIADVTDVLRASLMENHVQKKEARFFLQRGERVLDLHAAPLHDAEGDQVGAVVVLHDISELRRLESLREEFVANVSHELKTPITAIRGFLESVIEDGDMSTHYRTRFLSRAKDQLERLSDLVSDLLSLARLESEETQLDFGPRELGPLAESLVEEFEAVARARSIDARAELDPSDPSVVWGDQEGLRQIVSNLLSNALRYSKEAGNVRVRVFNDNGFGIVEVEDDGNGISPSDQKRIFERFYRADRARSREVGGTGLGLSIVKHLCRAHQGRVEVESAVGAGSTFRVAIPLASHRAQSAVTVH